MAGIGRTGSGVGLVPWYPTEQHDIILGNAPWDWAGTADRDGTAQLFIDAPLGSRYTRVTGSGTVDMYVKTANTNNTNSDWTVIGDLT